MRKKMAFLVGILLLGFAVSSVQAQDCSNVDCSREDLGWRIREVCCKEDKPYIEPESWYCILWTLAPQTQVDGLCQGSQSYCTDYYRSLAPRGSHIEKLECKPSGSL